MLRLAEPRKGPHSVPDTALGFKARAVCAALQDAGPYPVRITEKLSHDEPPTRLDHAVQLTQSGVLIRNLAKGGDEECTIETIVRVWKRTRVSPRPHQILKTALARRFHGVVEHLLLKIEDLKRPVRPEQFGHR